MDRPKTTRLEDVRNEMRGVADALFVLLEGLENEGLLSAEAAADIERDMLISLPWRKPAR